MAIFLDEMNMGADGNTIGFPHLLLCMGFVAVVKNPTTSTSTVWGVHLTSIQTSPQTFSVFAAEMLDTVNPKHIVAIYGSCNRAVRYQRAELAPWRAEMKAFAGTLKFKGPARGFDTSVIAPREGTYVQYDLVLPLGTRCDISYLRNEKMVFGGRAKTDMGKKVELATRTFSAIPEKLRNNPKLIATTHNRVETSGLATTSATPKSKTFGTRTLRQVDITQHLTEVYVGS